MKAAMAPRFTGSKGAKVRVPNRVAVMNEGGYRSGTWERKLVMVRNLLLG